MKVCPLAAANPQQSNSDCLGEACACYVKMHKQRILHVGGLTVPDDKFYLRYRGCGLISRIPGTSLKLKLTKQPHRQSGITDFGVGGNGWTRG
ncbi:MAG: hypothetical protein ACQCN3_12455 [Candidatus Bathyarchaeia archaeon]|jgi:hypothetical protein